MAIICLLTAVENGGNRVKIHINRQFEEHVRNVMASISGNSGRGRSPLSEPSGSPQFGTYSYVA
jgi:hypothetical protein